MLLERLVHHGVKQIFAYPGGAVLPIYDCMPAHNIRRILVRHEQAAAFAAQGYSRATQEVGVCLATSGPGATNLVTGIADAKMDSIPMVAITGNVFGHLIGSDAFQEVDIVGVCEPIVKHSYFIEKADDIPRVLAEAFHLALSGRPGPVLIDMPKSVQIEAVAPEIEAKIKSGEQFKFDLPGYFAAPECPFSEIDEAVEMIQKATRPVVIFGHGVILSNAEKELKEFLEKSQIPATWTLHGIGALPEDHPSALGLLGMHGLAAANFAVHHADLIIGIGTRFDDRITGVISDFEKNKKIIHFDIDPSEFDKVIKTDAKICGEIHETLPQLTKKLTTSDISKWHQQLEGKKEEWPLEKAKSDELTEVAVIEALKEVLDEDSVVVVDVGQHEMWTAQRCLTRAPRKFLASGGLGTMGFSLPTAMGATFSGHETWSVSGDGGFQMNLQELATIAQDKIPVKIIILNNGFLGMVRQWQDLFFKKNYVDTPLWNPDFVKLGEAYGIPSFRAKNLEETKDLLQQMKSHDGAILAEFVVKKEENVFPMVPAGESLGNTLLTRDKKINNN